MARVFRTWRLLLRAGNIITLQPAASGNAAAAGNRRWLMRRVLMSGCAVAALAAVLLAAGPASARPAIFSQAHAGFRAAPAAAAALPAPVPCNTSAGSCWQPPLAATWQYQLQGSVSSSGQCIYPSTGFINTAMSMYDSIF